MLKLKSKYKPKLCVKIAQVGKGCSGLEDCYTNCAVRLLLQLYEHLTNFKVSNLTVFCVSLHLVASMNTM
jgi:hypothetical protein